MSVLLALVLQASMTGSPVQAATPPTPLPHDAIFLFGRARYFHEIVNARNCVRRFPRQIASLNARFGTDRAALMQRFGASYFSPGEIDSKERGSGQQCDQGTLEGFEEKLFAIERLLGTPRGAGDRGDEP